ncbi:TonB family protein [Thiomonas sp. X19]|uniref:energy transducer TonB n=1 Tax=Thiomonas sp. X19 TaxID=1050370 RepID=UPI000B6ADAC3|nr:energy transducer TonB [Thiomonas sp. X19]SCC93904.1 TonB family protein [Thiomonas sp. X19]
MSAVLQHAPQHWREPHDGQRWPLAAGAALLLEVVIVGALLWLADHASAPPPPAPMQIVLDAPKPAPQTVAPPTPRPPVPKPLPKPTPKPVVKPRPRPVLHKVAPKPAQPPPPPPVATPKLEAPPAPVPDTKPAMPVAAPTPPAPPQPPAPPAPDAASIKAGFEAALRSAIQAAVRYPQAARLMRLTGQTLVDFTFTRGRATVITISRSSGNSGLDQAAILAVKNAQYPPTPRALGNAVMHFQIWVRFKFSN